MSDDETTKEARALISKWLNLDEDSESAPAQSRPTPARNALESTTSNIEDMIARIVAESENPDHEPPTREPKKRPSTRAPTTRPRPPPHTSTVTTRTSTHTHPHAHPHSHAHTRPIPHASQSRTAPGLFSPPPGVGVRPTRGPMTAAGVTTREPSSSSRRTHTSTHASYASHASRASRASHALQPSTHTHTHTHNPTCSPTKSVASTAPSISVPGTGAGAGNSNEPALVIPDLNPSDPRFGMEVRRKVAIKRREQREAAQRKRQQEKLQSELETQRQAAEAVQKKRAEATQAAQLHREALKAQHSREAQMRAALRATEDRITQQEAQWEQEQQLKLREMERLQKERAAQVVRERKRQQARQTAERMRERRKVHSMHVALQCWRQYLASLHLAHRTAIAHHRARMLSVHMKGWRDTAREIRSERRLREKAERKRIRAGQMRSAVEHWCASLLRRSLQSWHNTARHARAHDQLRKQHDQRMSRIQGFISKLEQKASSPTPPAAQHEMMDSPSQHILQGQEDPSVSGAFGKTMESEGSQCVLEEASGSRGGRVEKEEGSCEATLSEEKRVDIGDGETTAGQPEAQEQVQTQTQAQTHTSTPTQTSAPAQAQQPTTGDDARKKREARVAANLERRAKEMKARRQALLERYHQIEKEKQQKQQEAAEAAAREKAAARQAIIDQRRKEKRMQRELEERRRQALERAQQRLRLALQHWAAQRMRLYGWNPWRRYIAMIQARYRLACLHDARATQRHILTQWRADFHLRRAQEACDRSVQLGRAARVGRRVLLRPMWDAWREYLPISHAETTLACTHHTHTLLHSHFSTWLRHFRAAQLRTAQRELLNEQKASQFLVRNMYRKYVYGWREGVRLGKEERQRAERLNALKERAFKYSREIRAAKRRERPLHELAALSSPPPSSSPTHTHTHTHTPTPTYTSTRTPSRRLEVQPSPTHTHTPVHTHTRSTAYAMLSPLTPPQTHTYPHTEHVSPQYGSNPQREAKELMSPPHTTESYAYRPHSTHTERPTHTSYIPSSEQEIHRIPTVSHTHMHTQAQSSNPNSQEEDPLIRFLRMRGMDTKI